MGRLRKPWRGEDYANKGWTPETTRTCTGCGKTLPAKAEYFYLSVGQRFGLSSKCIECARAYGIATYPAKRERRSATTAAWSKANRGRKRAADVAWSTAHPLRKKVVTAISHLRSRHKHQNHPPGAFPTIGYLEEKLREFLIAEGFDPENPPLGFLKTEVQNLHRTPIKHGGGPQPENLFWGTRGQNAMMGDKTLAQVVPELTRFILRLGSEHATTLYNQLGAALATTGAA